MARAAFLGALIGVVLLVTGSLGAFCPEQQFSSTVFLNAHVDANNVLEDMVLAVSARDSPTRGHYLSTAQVRDIMQPNAAVAKVVQKAFETRGFANMEMSPWSDLLAFNTTFAQLKKAFSANMKCTEANGKTLCVMKTIPADLREHVAHWLVAPLMPVLATCKVSEKTRARRAATPLACLSADHISKSAYSVPVFPPPPAFLDAFWNATSATANFMANFTILPRCYKSSDTYTFIPLSSAYVDSSNFHPVNSSSLCGGSNTRLDNYTLTFTDTATNATFTATGGVSSCQDLAIPVCVDSVRTVNYTLAYCLLQVSLPLLTDHQYALDVNVTVSNGSSYSAPVCVYSGTNTCQRKLFVPRVPVLPDHVRSMYGIPSTQTAAGTSSSQGLLTIHPPTLAYYSPSDLLQFHAEAQTAGFNQSWVSFVSSPTLTAFALSYVQSVAYSAQLAQLGSTLAPIAVQSQTQLVEPSVFFATVTSEVQWLSAIGQGAQTYVFHAGYFNNIYNMYSPCFFCQALDVLLAVQYGAIVPGVITLSSGFVEGCEGDAPSPLRSFLEYMFRIFGTIGTTVIAASGDQGSHPSCDTVFSGFPIDTYSDQCSLTVTYPASSVYVAAVGATQMVNMCKGSQCALTEVPATLLNSPITSGGGFSPHDFRASWQTPHITAYLNATANSALFPSTNHNQQNHSGYPDVASLATPLQIVFNGVAVAYSGTAAAAATVAGMVTLVNAALDRAGKARLGFLNPFLYSAPPVVFNDIVTGDNLCVGMTASQDFCCTGGYPSAAGWDPVTGLGSINFPALLQYAMATQGPAGNSTMSPYTTSPVFPTRVTTMPSTTHTTTATTHTTTVPPTPPTGASSGSSDSSSFHAQAFLIAMPVLLGLGVASTFFIYAKWFAGPAVSSF